MVCLMVSDLRLYLETEELDCVSVLVFETRTEALLP